MYTIPCPRCAGAGKLWNHSNVMGGVCFACKGTKTAQTKASPEARAKAAERKATKQAEAKANQAARAAAYAARLDALIAKYAGDSRLPARAFEFPAVMAECVQILARVDAGELPPRKLS